MWAGKVDEKFQQFTSYKVPTVDLPNLCIPSRLVTAVFMSFFAKPMKALKLVRLKRGKEGKCVKGKRKERREEDSQKSIVRSRCYSVYLSVCLSI